MMRDKFIFHPFWVITVLPKRAIKNAGFSLVFNTAGKGPFQTS